MQLQENDEHIKSIYHQILFLKIFQKGEDMISQLWVV